MNNMKSRSSLKKVTKAEVEAARTPRRRISFSGKKFIREFDTTEKARDYDNSYEISDHTNGDDSSGQSHVTGAASALQVTAHITLANEMDKENTPLVSVKESISSEYDQSHRNDFTLQLQTSVNVTLMPHELAKKLQPMDLSAPLESMAFDSLSLSDVERDRLRESMFKMPINDKTMDLIPHKMALNELHSNTLEKENIQKTILTATDMSCVAPKEKDIQQKTVVFENNDITCDFTDIAPPPVVPATTEQTTFESFNMQENDSLNYLPDDSTSSPLIPLDVISENGISRKLNFRQLNEALNAGRIQLFPNGPRTPNTDRIVKPSRFWHGLEQQPMEEEIPLREAIKPRGTLNFNESMTMSPISQQPQFTTNQSDKASNNKELPDIKRNNRFSQADELMLDNTNFLAHAKMGDETQSRNSSKSASRRETTYDNTAMELDDLEKQEAAVVAALEKATRRPQVPRLVDETEDYLCSTEQDVANMDPISGKDQHANQKLSRTMKLNETVEEDCTKQPVKDQEQEYIIRRQTIHFIKDIDEDAPSPSKELPARAEHQTERRRQTLHIAEDIDEEMPSPRHESHLQSIAHPVKQHTSQRRQTLHLAEPIEEDADDAGRKVKSTTSPAPERTGHQRKTLYLAEDIDEDRHSPTKLIAPLAEVQSSRRRQTLHMAESIEEDLFEPKELKSQPAKDSDQKHWTRRRQTVHLAETIEEDVVKVTNDCHIKQPPPAVVRRHTLLFSEDIEEELLRPEQEFQLNSLVSQNEKQSCSRRQTLLLSEPIEEEVINPKEVLKPRAAEQHSRRRKTVQMAEPIEVDIIKPQTSTDVVEHIAKSIDEDMLSPLKDLHISSMAPKLEQQISRRRQTLHTAEPIEEDLCGQEEVFKSQPVIASEEQLSTRRRQTIPIVVPIEEDFYNTETTASENIMEFSTDINVVNGKTQQGLLLNEVTPPWDQQCNRRRQTVHRVEPIEEDSISSHKNLISTQTNSKIQFCGKQQEEIVEEPVLRPHKPQTERETNFSPEADTIPKPRQTIHVSEPIVVEDCVNATMMKEDEMPRQAPNKSKANKDDLSLFELGSASPPNTKPRQTLCMAVDMDEDMPKASGAKQRRNKSGMTFLEDFDSESSSPNLEKNTENTSQESQSDSAKWLTQMNAKLRKTLVNPIKDEVSKSIINPTIGNRTSMETPQSHRTRRGYFPITPGRSIIEYEDLEEMCNIESPAPPAAAPTNYHLADMDVSNYGTPIGIAKTSTSYNSKRLPIHLTPNLPEPKKRNKQLSEKLKVQETSLELDATMREEEQLTPTAVNRSCFPRSCQTLSSNSSWQEAEQLDGTVQMVRAQLMRQTRSFFDTNAICTAENKMQLEETTAAVFENNPITISDVSTHFAAQKELAKQSLANPAKDPKNISSNSRSSNENSNKSYVRAHKKFINLSGDTVIFDAAEIIDLASDDNEIEKTRLSLVETLLDEEEGDIRDASDNHSEVVPVFETKTETEPDACLSQLIPPTVAGTADACKKCKHCRRSIDGTRESVSDTFVLPDWNALDHGLQRLKRLRQQPRLAEVHKYWELKKLARYSNASDNISVMNVDANDNEQFPTLTEMLEMFNKKLEQCTSRLPEPVVVKPYVELLAVKLCDQVPNWIFDHQLECDRQYILSHRKITTFRIVISYVPIDDMETEIRVHNIKAMTATTILKSNWSEYEHLMDFQVRLRLPLNLLNLLDGNGVDDVVKFMQHVDTICLETRQMCNHMHLLLLSKGARLLRQSNRAIVRKTVRRMFQFKDEAYMRVEKINFVIEIGNLEEISFKDILQPPLYQFDEKIRFFPKGLGFLKAFLTNPEQYLKPTESNN